MYGVKRWTSTTNSSSARSRRPHGLRDATAGTRRSRARSRTTGPGLPSSTGGRHASRTLVPTTSCRAAERSAGSCVSRILFSPALFSQEREASERETEGPPADGSRLQIESHVGQAPVFCAGIVAKCTLVLRRRDRTLGPDGYLSGCLRSV